MANKWDVEDGNSAPGKSDRYEWRLPDNGEQHQAQIVTPGGMLIKPGDITLIPTLAPKQSGLQHGTDDWTVVTRPTSSWYVLGDILQEE